MAFPSSGSSPGSMTPSGRRSMFLTSTPRTPSQQPSLTFSQTTPGSAKSDISTFVVPPGFHSHYRRRQKQKKQSGDAFRIPPANHQSVKDTIIIDSGGGALVGELDPMDENNWEDQENEAEDDQQTDPFGPVRKPLPKKKYTQKRSTRLHRIAVAPSEKVEAARPVKTPRKRRPVKTDELESTTNQNKNEPAVNQEENSNTTEAPAVSANEPGVSGITSKAKPSNTEESVPFGWANSNRPMVKSDRRAPGVGQGRAGPKRAVPSKYGGSGSDGNFVAYNLQRGGFRKGGARGRPRFGGSKFGSYGAGGPGSGRTLFDNESWRTEFDNDFNDATLAMNIVDGDMEIEGDDDHLGDMPWYGNVNDITDPYVVTVSSRYLKAQVGDVDDPEEYVKALELQSHGDSNDAGWGEETEAVRVNLEHILKKVWGYPSFRDGQLDSIKRALNYKSSLLVLPTGSGKSLSYQLPAYIFSKLGIPSLTLVISPMISLMYDQVRPAYLLLNHVLKTDLKSPCVLGLTGTATEGTKDSICAMLDIDRATGVLSGPVIRENLAMTVSLETDRETALLHLLQSPRFASMGSILIYVMKQIQADALAAFLRVRNFSTESYHAGKSSQDRQRIQQRFMNEGPQKGVIAGGTLGSNTASGASPSGIRILVATIAFGLGLNKSNIRSVIHYCMPKSLENYVQEIGRSGRDGEKAYCHMFLNQDDYLRLRSLAYADGMDWGTVLRLVKKLFSRKGIADPLSMQSGKGSSTKAVSKKRRGIGNKGADGNRPGNDENGSEDGALSPGAKKRKQNDRQPLSVKMGKAGNKAESKQQSLILSTASILVIPPAAGMVLPDKSNVLHPRRVVVVREELAEEEFDIKKEVLATLLSYIELDPSRPIKVVGSISAKCTVKFLQTSEALSELADKIPLVDIILKQGVLTGHNSNSGSSYGKGRRGNMTGLAGTTLSMAYCCDTMSLCQQSDMNYSELLQELQLWKRKKWAVFEMTDPGLCVEILKEAGDCMVEYRQQKREQQRREAQRRRKGHRRSGPDMDMDVDEAQGRYSISPTGSEDEQERDANAYEKDHDDFIVALADRLYQKLCAVERVGVAKVDQVYTLFQSVATPTWQQQEVYRPKIQDIGNDDQNEEASEDANEGDESSEYDEDVDPEYIQMRARMKARARSSQNGVSKSEIILRQGIQDYFAKHSGEGIGGPSAAEDFFSHIKDSTTTLSSVADKTMRLYSYENAIVTNLQRKWKSAVEVDLKVFLSQQWQLQQQQNQTMSEYGGAAGKTNELSPRAVSRIFHGISSPCYPALEWSRHRYWAKIPGSKLQYLKSRGVGQQIVQRGGVQAPRQAQRDGP
ncbi:hypothetical protein BC939DRAFT_475845 [Gamsiella multidivaricata]|uniref:uncharacterized protein n=1 Tax=Gamsiella multidivaricata TaxID=101098 RepID=UPI002220EABF|nr:uncharacterized protein BC939DRAFT_475845 [Gamsiella multidivaricata]KAI7826146.1 hypothetical protein BC939DRAFT_475845 [Gamsiella multidivaricata]